MAKKSVLGLYTEEDSAADALDNLRDAGFEEGEYELLTGTPYPEGTFGEAEPEHHLFSVATYWGSLWIHWWLDYHCRNSNGLSTHNWRKAYIVDTSHGDHYV